MDNVDWLDPLEERAWRGFRRIVTLMPPRIERDLRVDAQLSAADYEVLSNLSEEEDHSYRLMDLAERLLWSRSRLSHHLERMEVRNLNREPLVSSAVSKNRRTTRLRVNGP